MVFISTVSFVGLVTGESCRRAFGLGLFYLTVCLLDTTHFRLVLMFLHLDPSVISIFLQAVSLFSSQA